MSVALGQFYFGDLHRKWVSFQSALTPNQRSRSVKLQKAAEHVGHTWTGDAHRALADALACRSVWLWLESRRTADEPTTGSRPSRPDACRTGPERRQPSRSPIETRDDAPDQAAAQPAQNPSEQILLRLANLEADARHRAIQQMVRQRPDLAERLWYAAARKQLSLPDSVEPLLRAGYALIELENSLVLGRTSFDPIRDRLASVSGSVTPLRWIREALESLDSEAVERFDDWALQHACNPYVPYGSTGWPREVARSAAQYRMLLDARSDRQRGEAEAYREYRRMVGETRRRQMRERQLIRSVARTNRIAALEEFTPPDRMRCILSDQDHPPCYYPAEWAHEMTRENIAQLTDQECFALMEQLERAPRGAWRRLRTRITRHLASDECSDQWAHASRLGEEGTKAVGTS